MQPRIVSIPAVRRTCVPKELIFGCRDRATDVRSRTKTPKRKYLSSIQYVCRRLRFFSRIWATEVITPPMFYNRLRVCAFTEEAIITSYRFSQEIFADSLCRLDEFLHIFYHHHIPHTAIVLRPNTSHCTSAEGIHFKQFEKRKIGREKIAWVIHCLNNFNVQIVEWWRCTFLINRKKCRNCT